MNNKEPQNVWQYIEWLEKSGRITLLESDTLEHFLYSHDDEVAHRYSWHY